MWVRAHHARAELDEAHFLQGLCEHIGDHLFCGTILHDNVSRLSTLANEVLLCVDVLGALLEHWILDQREASLVVF